MSNAPLQPSSRPQAPHFPIRCVYASVAPPLTVFNPPHPRRTATSNASAMHEQNFWWQPVNTISRVSVVEASCYVPYSSQPVLSTQTTWKRPYGTFAAFSGDSIAASSSRTRISRPVPPPPQPAPFVHTPQIVELALASPNSSATAAPIRYQFASDLYRNLQRLLFFQHAPFLFHGTFSLVADPSVNNEARVRAVAQELIAHTVLSFNVDRMPVLSSPNMRTALVAFSSSALVEPIACAHCEHMLTIDVKDDGAHWLGLPGQLVSVQLKHFLAPV
ncbi:hypothetical protein B0H10DRAFT_2226789 [Mycena sp. CBHHK59/15]|nr:hypothetical protein B0H10DRAFT_2226789 [Mycena sp. CBHHK59/15]